MPKLIVLNFHKITTTKASVTSFEVTVNKLELILGLALKQKVITIKDWNNNLEDGKYIAITFDDANKSDIEIVLPILTNYNIKATFFYNQNTLNKNGYCSETELIKIQEADHEIGYHGYAHISLPKLNKPQLLDEISPGKIRTKYFAFPYGKYNKVVIERLKNLGYNKLFTTQQIINKNPSSLLVHRINVKNSFSTNRIVRILSFSKMYWKYRAVLSTIKFKITNQL